MSLEFESEKGRERALRVGDTILNADWSAAASLTYWEFFCEEKKDLKTVATRQKTFSTQKTTSGHFSSFLVFEKKIEKSEKWGETPILACSDW